MNSGSCSKSRVMLGAGYADVLMKSSLKQQTISTSVVGCIVQSVKTSASVTIDQSVGLPVRRSRSCNVDHIVSCYELVSRTVGVAVGEYGTMRDRHFFFSAPTQHLYCSCFMDGYIVGVNS